MYSSNPVIGKLNLSFKIKKNRGREWPIFQKIMILKNCLIEDLSPGTLVFDGTALTTLPQSRHLLFFLFCFWSRLLNNLIHFSVASDNWLFFNLIFRPLRWSLRPLLRARTSQQNIIFHFLFCSIFQICRSQNCWCQWSML